MGGIITKSVIHKENQSYGSQYCHYPNKINENLLRRRCMRSCNDQHPSEFQLQPIGCASKSKNLEGNAFSSMLCTGDRSPVVLLPSLNNFPRLSKHQINCLVFLTLLLTSEYAEAISGSSLLSLDLKIGQNSRLVSTFPTNIVSQDPAYKTRDSIKILLKHKKINNPVKRDANLRMRFLNSHRRAQRLVTKHGYFVEIKRSGKVKGTRKRNMYSLFELTSIRPGVIALKSIKTGRYLAMDPKGNLVGLKTYTSACNFYERVIENNFFVYFQNIRFVGKRRATIKQVYMGFDNKGKPKKGKKVHRNDNSAHFQKRPVVYPIRRRSRPKKRKGKKPKIYKSKQLKNSKKM